jgi:hypothetical protein
MLLHGTWPFNALLTTHRAEDYACDRGWTIGADVDSDFKKQ